MALAGVAYALLTHLGGCFCPPCHASGGSMAGSRIRICRNLGLGQKKCCLFFFLAGTLSKYLTTPLHFAVLTETGNTLAVLLAYVLIKRFKNNEPLFGSSRNVILFILAGAFGHGIVSASAEILGLYLPRSPARKRPGFLRMGSAFFPIRP